MNAGFFGGSPGAVAPRPVCLIEGDSHSVLVDGNGTSTWVTYWQGDSAFSHTTFADYAVGGSTWENVRDRIATGAGLLYPVRKNQRVYFHCQASHGAIDNGESASSVYNGLAAIWAAAKAAGCIVGSHTQWAWSGITSPQLAVLQSVNASMASDPSLSVLYDAYTTFSPGGVIVSGDFWSDGLHLNSTGQPILAAGIKPLALATGALN